MADRKRRELAGRDVRRMLEIAADAGRLTSKTRWPFVLERLISLTDAEAGAIVRVARQNGKTQWVAIVDRQGASETPLRDDAASDASQINSIYALAGEGRYACVKLYRSAGFEKRHAEIAETVWQGLGELHEVE